MAKSKNGQRTLTVFSQQLLSKPWLADRSVIWSLSTQSYWKIASIHSKYTKAVEAWKTKCLFGKRCTRKVSLLNFQGDELPRRRLPDSQKEVRRWYTYHRRRSQKDGFSNVQDLWESQNILVSPYRRYHTAQLISNMSSGLYCTFGILWFQLWR